MLIRSKKIAQLRHKLNHDGYPRLQMMLLVAITGVAGFVASFLLLHGGVTLMWLRYLIAFVIGYVVFLGLLWLWLRTTASDYVDVPDFIPTGSISNGSPAPMVGRGGSFDGGGASGHFESPATAYAPVDLPAGDGKEWSEVANIADADEFAVPLIALACVLGLALSSLWIVYTAPLLFAELLVDGALAASLYKRLKGLETNHWLETAISRTVIPFLLTAALFVCAGAAIQHYAPDVLTLGQALAQLR